MCIIPLQNHICGLIAKSYCCGVKSQYINIQLGSFTTGIPLGLWPRGSQAPKLLPEILWFYTTAMGSCLGIPQAILLA